MTPQEQLSIVESAPSLTRPPGRTVKTVHVLGLLGLLAIYTAAFTYALAWPLAIGLTVLAWGVHIAASLSGASDSGRRPTSAVEKIAYTVSLVESALPIVMRETAAGPLPVGIAAGAAAALPFVVYFLLRWRG